MKKKLIAIALCAALAAGGVVAGSLAYFTDTDAVTNTFTVGDIQISLDETDVDTTGKPDGETRVKTNEYHLIPGHTYTKDPIVHVAQDSEDCYVFVTVDNKIEEIEGGTKIAEQMTANGWVVLDESKNKNLYVYDNDGNADTTGSVVAKNTAATDLKVFEQFQINGETVVGSGELVNGVAPEGKYYIGDYASKDAKGEDTRNVITVTAYAVQANGFTTALDAWNASFGKTTNQ